MSLVRNAVVSLLSGIATNAVVRWFDTDDRGVVEIAQDWLDATSPSDGTDDETQVSDSDSDGGNVSFRQPGGPENPSEDMGWNSDLPNPVREDDDGVRTSPRNERPVRAWGGE
jgi:hypothetical protein